MGSSIEIAEEKASFSIFNHYFYRFLPQNKAKQLLFFQLLSPCSLFLSSCFCFIYLGDGAYFFSLIASVGLCLIYALGIYGLGLSALILSSTLYFFSHLFNSGDVFSLIGSSCSMLLGLFIALLTLEECTKSVVSIQDEVEKEKIRTQEMTLSYHKKEEEINLLDEELEKWKEEAFQRRIEKTKDDEKIQLIEQEIKNFISQKDNLINESYEARLRANQREKECAEALNKLKLLEREKKENLDHILQLREQLSLITTQLESERKQIESQKCIQTELEESQKRIKEVIDSQTSELNQTRENSLKISKELHHTKELLTSSKRENHELLIKNQELIVLNQNQAVEAEKTMASQELQHKIIQLEGALKQLRLQFEEKKQTLHVARRELFATTGKLLSLEREWQSDKQNPDINEISSLQKMLQEMDQENQNLEEAVELLEDLIHKIILG